MSASAPHDVAGFRRRIDGTHAVLTAAQRSWLQHYAAFAWRREAAAMQRLCREDASRVVRPAFVGSSGPTSPRET